MKNEFKCHLPYNNKVKGEIIQNGNNDTKKTHFNWSKVNGKTIAQKSIVIVGKIETFQVISMDFF